MNYIPVSWADAPNFQPIKKPQKDYKIYHDGSHFVGQLIVRKKFQSHKKKRSTERKAIDLFFENYYFNATKTNLRGAAQKSYISGYLKLLYSNMSDMELSNYIDEQIKRVNSNLYKRKKRFRRKAHLNEWNYFVTITYDDKIHTADTFRKKLRKCLSNLHTRRGWRYMGVFEHGAENERLHFHMIAYVPIGEMIGSLFQKSDYDKTSGKMQTTIQNTFFNKNYGRSDFQELSNMELRFGTTIKYLLKYLGKTNERIVYSRGVPTEICKKLDDNDIIVEFQDFVPKYVLFDDVVDWQKDILKVKRKQLKIIDLLCNPKTSTGLGCVG